MNHYLVMFIIMIISGLFTNMNIYVDKFSDIRLSLNDIYMTLLMSGWMLFLMGVYYKDYNILYIGLFLIIFNFWAIRTQFMISMKQYIMSMIPHHSMAIHMSKKLKEIDNMNQDSNKIKKFLDNIVTNQNNEINLMKNEFVV